MIFIDSNIVIDLLQDGEWTPWSMQTVAAHSDEHLVANLIVFAEVSRAFGAVGDAVIFFRELGVTIAPITEEVSFRAGRTQVDYRLAGGRQGSILADFFIGAHASALGAKLMTRDKRRFATYFPELTLIAPETDHG